MTHLTQHQKILGLLREHPYGITTNQIIAAPLGLACEFRARIAELRKDGYVITCELHRGGASIYRLESEPPRVEANGQLCFLGATG